jgi:hypothetical protein
MLDTLLASLKGADPFEVAHGLSESDARRMLAQQWAALDRLASDDPAGYAEHLQAMAREAGVKLPDGMAERARGAAAAKPGGVFQRLGWSALPRVVPLRVRRVMHSAFIKLTDCHQHSLASQHQMRHRQPPRPPAQLASSSSSSSSSSPPSPCSSSWPHAHPPPHPTPPTAAPAAQQHQERPPRPARAPSRAARRSSRRFPVRLAAQQQRLHSTRSSSLNSWQK